MIKHNLPPGDYVGISKAGTTVAVVITEGGFWAHEFRSKLQVEFEDITAVMPARPPWFVCVPPEPEPKPLLADAKEGWLVTNREGHTSTIKHVDNNKEVLKKYAYEVSDGTTIYVRENGMFNLINHNSNYDIIATEPLAPEGSIDRALQDMKLGKRVKLQQTMFNMRGGKVWKWKISHSGALIGQYPVQSLDEWYRFYSGYRDIGWQLYEPEPQPQYKAGDWVEIEVSGVISQQLVKLGVFADSVNAGGIEFYGNGLPVMKPSNARIIRKLDPSEVRVKVTLEGTVLPYAKQVCRNDLFWLCFGNGERKRLSTAHLDPDTAALVRELLAAQEEK